MNEKESAGEKTIVVNRKARHDYHLLDRVEAGIALVGTEVKSLRLGKVNITDSYVLIENGQATLIGLNISPYDHGTHFNHNATRPRRLLLHKREIAQLLRQITIKGMTLIPTRLYFKNGRVKVEVSVAKGKASHDKREAIKERDIKRDMANLMRR